MSDSSAPNGVCNGIRLLTQAATNALQPICWLQNLSRIVRIASYFSERVLLWRYLQEVLLLTHDATRTLQPTIANGWSVRVVSCVSKRSHCGQSLKTESLRCNAYAPAHLLNIGWNVRVALCVSHCRLSLRHRGYGSATWRTKRDVLPYTAYRRRG